jgi:hypothetical protein
MTTLFLCFSCIQFQVLPPDCVELSQIIPTSLRKAINIFPRVEVVSRFPVSIYVDFKIKKKV